MALLYSDMGTPVRTTDQGEMMPPGNSPISET
jgi:hypothetical protein